MSNEFPTAGDRMAQQVRGFRAFEQGVEDASNLEDKLFAENMVAVAAVMATAHAFSRFRNALKIKRK
jgi:hypothetical protein